MKQFSYQLKQAFLSLKRKLGFVATVVTTMGTTLGALLCVLTLGFLLIVEPLPYPDQTRLYNVIHHIGDDKDEVNATAFTYPGLIHLYKNQDVFEQTALVHYGSDVLTSLPHQPTLNTAYVTPEWFDLLGTTPLIGRGFESTEALDTHNPVAIITYETWQKEFDGTNDILSKKIAFSGVSFSIVGVLNKDFIEPQIQQTGFEAGVWLPWDYNLDTNLMERWGNISGSLTFVGKLKPEISVAQAEQILTPLVSETWQENVASIEFFNGWSVEIELMSFKNAIVGESTSTVYKLLAGVIGLVLIALANVVNLFMSRTAEQQRQLSIYAALGAKKGQLFKGLFAESLLLMMFSLMVALVIATMGFAILQSRLSSELPRVNELSITWFTLLSAVLLACASALVFAYLSSKMINYKALNTSLQSSGKGTGIQVSKRLRQSLVVLQVTIASALVFVNITLFNDSVESITTDNGYSIDGMSQISVSISSSELPPAEERAADMLLLKQELLALPQVVEVSHSRSVLDGYGLWALTNVQSGENFTPESKRVSANYFSLVGQELIEGDFFSEADIADDNRVMVINEVFADRINPNGSAIGMQISNDPEEPSYTVIGIVKTAKRPASDDEPMRVYTPATHNTPTMTLKIADGQSVTREDVVMAIKTVGSQYALFSFNSLDEQRDLLLFTEYATAITTAVLAFITLFLAGVGLYGILSYSTQMRRFEIGTRMAIGAKRASIVSLIIKDNLGVVALGIGLSIIVTLIAYLTNKDFLSAYVSIELAGIFVITVVSILMLSLFACYWPLRRFINRPAIHSLRGSD